MCYIVYLGVYGTNTDVNVKRISTNFVNISIKEGAYRTGTTPVPPTVDLWETYFAQVVAERKLAQQAKIDAQLQADTATGQATVSTNKALIATDKANSASINKDATDTNVTVTVQNKQATEQIKADMQVISDRAARLVLQAESLLSNEPRQFLVKSIAERNNLIDLRQCDRCDVIDDMATYIYDMFDVDGDKINPEWILVSKWDALNSVDWAVITNKPNFAVVATSGNYTDLSNKPLRYEQFTTVTNGIWDYGVSDKIILSTTNLVRIDNVSNGAIGMINTTLDLALPTGSIKSSDYGYMSASASQHYLYTFMYDGNNYHWARTVCG